MVVEKLSSFGEPREPLGRRRLIGTAGTAVRSRSISTPTVAVPVLRLVVWLLVRYVLNSSFQTAGAAPLREAPCQQTAVASGRPSCHVRARAGAALPPFGRVATRPPQSRACPLARARSSAVRGARWTVVRRLSGAARVATRPRGSHRASRHASCTEAAGTGTGAWPCVRGCSQRPTRQRACCLRSCMRAPMATPQSRAPCTAVRP